MRYSSRTVATGDRALILRLPEWESLDWDAAIPTLKDLLKEERALADRLAKESPLRYEELMTPISLVSVKQREHWGPINHLNSVDETERSRKMIEEGERLIAEHASRIGMHEGLYHAFLAYRERGDYALLDEGRRKVIDDHISDFELAGVALPKEKKTRMTEIKKRLAELATSTESNVKSAVASWGKHVEDERVLRGVPLTAKESMHRAASAKGLPGYLISLHAPIYVPLMGYAEDRALREEVYRAFVTRASDEGPDAGKFDNMPLIQETLRLRDEMAKLLGYPDYVAFALKKRMVRSSGEAERFLDALLERAKQKGNEEMTELATFAKEEFGIDELRPWDIGFVAERLKEARFDFSQEEIRPYLPEGKVVHGMFSLVERIYGGHLKRSAHASVYRPGVAFYELYDAQGELRGGFYADLYARDGKNQGAWMDIVTLRSSTEKETTLPVAYLNANFTQPAEGEETYLLHSEVETIFHEFGHVLHHIFGRTDVPELSMNDVEWDAVESPSQVMENWAWERKILYALSAHRETGAALPDTLIDKLLSARHFHGALALLRQLEFAMVDLRLHLHPKDDPLATLAEVRNKVRVTPTIPEDRFLASFTHIFAGGYAAGYYSYLWAELIAADAFEAFQETGDAFDRSTGDLFLQSVLEVGSSRPFMRSYVEFRGREPDPDALLRSRGLLPSLLS